MLRANITLAAVVVAFAAALLATADPLQQCPWGRCEDPDSEEEEEVTYMNLLQMQADSRKTEKDVMEHHRAAPGAMPGANNTADFLLSADHLQHSPRSALQNTLKKIQTMHPYYHTSEQIHKKAELLSKDCGGAMKMETMSDGGVDIDVVHVRAPKSNPVNKVFILFGEHSRELISPESAIRMMELLCGKATIDGDKGDMISNVLLDSEFQLVLNGNPKSRSKVEDGEFCLRTNPSGVDLNRNWDERWEEDNGMDQTNPGPRPFSEPETRIFRKLVERYQPTTFLTVHSGTRGLYMPWAYDMHHTAKFNAPLMLEILKDLDKNHCQCPFGAAGKEVGYPCPGTCLDWVYSKIKTPFVFAFEIYTDEGRNGDLKRRWDELSKDGLKLLQEGSHLGHEHFGELFSDFTSDFVQRRHQKEEAEKTQDACFSMFNPDSEIVYNETVQNWAVTYLEMATKVATDLKTKKIL